MKKYILAIESSCDESAAAVISLDGHVCSNVIHSQIDIHSTYGGVVPEVASREHLVHLPVTVERALAEADICPAELAYVAATIAPGLIGPLLVGVEYAKGLAVGLGVPFIPVHHIEGHLWAASVDADGKPMGSIAAPPFLGLIVSGGHTALYDYRGIGDIRILGETRDDAAGEAFDKSAKLMGLGYPGGAKLSQLGVSGNPEAFAFPIAMKQKGNLEFSFSGLKNAVRLAIVEHAAPDGGLELQTAQDIAASVEAAIIEALVLKTKWALKSTGHTTLVLGGGVSANDHLRRALSQMTTARNVRFLAPAKGFTTDNAAMIGLAARAYIQKGLIGRLSAKATAWLPLDVERPGHFE